MLLVVVVKIKVAGIMIGNWKIKHYERWEYVKS
jgi:hypothetical protein